MASGEGPHPVPAAIWDQEFASGKWDYLGGLPEMARYAVIAGYAALLPRHASVLDVGCGAGLLQPWLARAGCSDYLGIDLSATAIAAAQPGDGISYATADAATFTSARPFDIVVFNEMLYYMADPAAVLRRYAEFLAPGGASIISLWDCDHSRQIWRGCTEMVELLDTTKIDHDGTAWQVSLCRPR